MPIQTAQRDVWLRAATHAAFLSNGLGFGIWIANLPRLKDALALDAADLGILLFLVSIGAVAAMPLAGWLSLRGDPARLAALCGLGGAVLLCLPVLAPGWAAVLIAGATLGLFLGGMDVAMNSAASAVETQWGRPLMSSFHAGWSGGGLAGAGLAGALASAGAGLAASYILPGLLVAALAVPSLTVRTPAAHRGGGGFALPSRKLLAVVALAGIAFGAEGGVADWSGIYLKTELGTDAAWAASAFGSYSLAMATGRLTGDWLVRLFGARLVAGGGGALAAFGLAIVLAAPGVLLADAGLVLIGLGLANIVPVVFSAAGRLQGAAGVAMASTAGYAGFMATPPVLGFAAQAFGLRAALMLVLAGIAGLAVLGWRSAGLRPALRHGSHLPAQ